MRILYFNITFLFLSFSFLDPGGNKYCQCSRKSNDIGSHVMLVKEKKYSFLGFLAYSWAIQTHNMQLKF
jgi:hypothetical protein